MHITPAFCRLTVPPHAGNSVLVAALGRERERDVGVHLASGDGVAADAFGAVVCSGVLREADQTVFAGGVCRAYEISLSVDSLSLSRSQLLAL